MTRKNDEDERHGYAWMAWPRPPVKRTFLNVGAEATSASGADLSCGSPLMTVVRVELLAPPWRSALLPATPSAPDSLRSSMSLEKRLRCSTS